MLTAYNALFDGNKSLSIDPELKDEYEVIVKQAYEVRGLIVAIQQGGSLSSLLNEKAVVDALLGMDKATLNQCHEIFKWAIKHNHKKAVQTMLDSPVFGAYLNYKNVPSHLYALAIECKHYQIATLLVGLPSFVKTLTTSLDPKLNHLVENKVTPVIKALCHAFLSSDRPQGHRPIRFLVKTVLEKAVRSNFYQALNCVLDIPAYAQVMADDVQRYISLCEEKHALGALVVIKTHPAVQRLLGEDEELTPEVIASRLEATTLNPASGRIYVAGYFLNSHDFIEMTEDLPNLRAMADTLMREGCAFAEFLLQTTQIFKTIKKEKQEVDVSIEPPPELQLHIASFLPMFKHYPRTFDNLLNKHHNGVAKVMQARKEAVLDGPSQR